MGFLASHWTFGNGTFHELATWLAVGAGLGYVPVLASTLAALAGVLLSLVASRMRRWAQSLWAAGLVALAIPICHYGSLSFGETDDARIVADELLAFPVATLALPIRRQPALLACTFVASRVLDHAKPPPAGMAETLPGGLGIVLDDVIANGWTLLLVALGWWWYRRSLRAT